MKKLTVLAVVAAVALFAGQAFAAGSGVVRYSDRDRDQPYGMVWEFTADDATAAVPTLTVPSLTGYISAIDVEFDGTPPPDSVTLAITSANNTPILTSAALTAAGRVTTTGGAQIPVAGGFKIAVTTNTTNSAKFKLIVYGLFDDTY